MTSMLREVQRERIGLEGAASGRASWRGSSGRIDRASIASGETDRRQRAYPESGSGRSSPSRIR